MECGRFKMIKKLTKFILPVLLGITGGYLYYHFIGCNNGCAITGNPITSMAYGAFIGAVLTDWKGGIKLIKNKGKDDEKEHGHD